MFAIGIPATERALDYYRSSCLQDDQGQWWRLYERNFATQEEAMAALERWHHMSRYGLRVIEFPYPAVGVFCPVCGWRYHDRTGELCLVVEGAQFDLLCEHCGAEFTFP
jgi:hypothetical protein